MSHSSLFDRTINLDTVHEPFYLDLLEQQHIDVSTLTVDDFFFRDEALEERCLEVSEPYNVPSYECDARELLADYPTNAHALLAIAEGRCIDEVTLNAALALRELANYLLRRQLDGPYDEATLTLLSCVGIEVLFEQMLLLDVSDHLFNIMFDITELAPVCKDYLAFTALRCGAVFEINRYDGQTTNFFTIMRNGMSGALEQDQTAMQLIALANIVYTFMQADRITPDIQAQIDALLATAPTKLLYADIDFYRDAEPTLERLFDSFPMPHASLPSNPSKDLHRLIARQNLSSIEEITAFVNQFMNKPIPEIPFEELTEDEKAEDAAEAAMQLPKAQQRARMLELVQQYPTTLWPWVGLIGTSSNYAETLDFAEKGLAVAHKNAIDARSEAHVILLHARAQALMFEHRYAEAIQAYELVLSTDENMMAKVGESLLTLLIRRGQRPHLERAEQVIAALQQQDLYDLPALPWLTLLFHIIRKRHTSVINVALAEAMQQHPEIGLLITGLTVTQSSYDVPRTLPDEEDTVIRTIVLCQVCWPAYPDAVKQLKKMLQISTPPGISRTT